MAAILFHEPIFATIVDSGDKLYFFKTGTSDSLTVYTDAGLTTPTAHPVVADANGRFPAIYFDPSTQDAKVQLKDSADNQKWSMDPYPLEDTASLDTRLTNAELAIISNGGDIATNESDISTLQTESADYESRITTLENATPPTDYGSIVPVAMGSVTGGASPVYGQSYGVTGTVSRSASGVFAISFTTARANSDYIVQATAGSVASNSPLECLVTNKSTTGFTIETWYTTGGSTRDKVDRDFDFVVFDLDQ